MIGSLIRYNFVLIIACKVSNLVNIYVVDSNSCEFVHFEIQVHLNDPKSDYIVELARIEVIIYNAKCNIM
jgi:hypothetical protein